MRLVGQHCHVPSSRSTRTKVFNKECYESRTELSGYGNVLRNADAVESVIGGQIPSMSSNSLPHQNSHDTSAIRMDAHEAGGGARSAPGVSRVHISSRPSSSRVQARLPDRHSTSQPIFFWRPEQIFQKMLSGQRAQIKHS